MRVSAVILAVLVSLTLGIDLTHKDCGSSATITKVFSPDCEDQVCKLKKGLYYPSLSSGTVSSLLRGYCKPLVIVCLIYSGHCKPLDIVCLIYSGHCKPLDIVCLIYSGYCKPLYIVCLINSGHCKPLDIVCLIYSGHCKPLDIVCLIYSGYCKPLYIVCLINSGHCKPLDIREVQKIKLLSNFCYLRLICCS